MTEKSYYTIAETAKILGVSEMTIRRNIKSGSIDATKVLGRWRITKSVIDSMIV